MFDDGTDAPFAAIVERVLQTLRRFAGRSWMAMTDEHEPLVLAATDGSQKVQNGQSGALAPGSRIVVREGGDREARRRVGWLVVFPDVQCPLLTPEATRGEIVDRFDLDNDIGERVANAPSLVALSKRTDLLPPAPQTCARMIGFLRPEFEKVPAPASQDWDIETRLRQLTKEQFEALDTVEDNRVCLLKGPAGTGKTLIGMEAARRDAGPVRARGMLQCRVGRLDRPVGA